MIHGKGWSGDENTYIMRVLDCRNREHHSLGLRNQRRTFLARPAAVVASQNDPNRRLMCWTGLAIVLYKHRTNRAADNARYTRKSGQVEGSPGIYLNSACYQNEVKRRCLYQTLRKPSRTRKPNNSST